jgi:hypothetical protein
MTSSSAPSSRKSIWQVRPSPAFVGLFFRIVLVLAILHAVVQVGCFLPLQMSKLWSIPGNGHDMDIYYKAAVRLKQGADIYQPWDNYGPHLVPNRFFYSPPFFLLTRPLVELDYTGFGRVWLVLMMGAFWVYAACLAKLAMGRWNWKGTLVFCMLTNMSFGGNYALNLGQFEPVMWMLLGLALTTKNRAGWLVWATLVKVHPVWSLALALYEGKARAWKQMLLFALPVLLASLWLVGAHNWAMWWPSTGPVAAQGTFFAGNCSFSFFGLRVANYLGWLQATAPLPLWAKAYLSLCAVGAPLGMAFAARKASFELRLALVASVTILFSPLCWSCYYPILLLPAAVWLGERHGSLMRKAFA